MAIFKVNGKDFYPLSLSDPRVPRDVVRKAGAVVLVCAEGQPFVTKNGISPRTSNHYFRHDPRLYPEAVPEKSLCAPWADEPAVWTMGTAFAIGARRFVSCRHVVEEVLGAAKTKDEKKLRVVSGYYTTKSSSRFQYTMLKVARVHYGEGDYCEMVTTRSLPSHIPTFEFADDDARAGELVSVVGHPLGQQLKYAEGRVARRDADSFTAWLTGFPGNSGSPVLRARTGKVLGVFCEGTGESEFALDKKRGCYQYARFGRNEDDWAIVLKRQRC